MSPEGVRLNIRGRGQFSAEALDEYGNSISEVQITWEAQEDVGIIDDRGLLTAGRTAGIYNRGVTVAAVLGDVSREDTAAVTVDPDPLDSLVFASIEIAAGESVQLEASAADRYGNRPSDVALNWVVLETNAGSITETSLFTPGEVALTLADAVEAEARQGQLVQTARGAVTIVPGPLSQLAIAPDPADIGMGMTQQFVVVEADQFGNRISGVDITWSVDAGGGTIDADGLFTAGTVPGVYDHTVMASTVVGDTEYWVKVGVVVQPDRIAFASDRDDGQWDLYLMDADGGNVVRLTQGIASIFPAASWSPDGRRVVIDACHGEPQRCEVIALGDDGAWLVVLSSQDDFWPSWSPDGTKIAFATDRDENREIYLMDVDGGNQVRLTDNSSVDTLPAWSPDSGKLAFSSDRDGNREIYVMNFDGSLPTRLTDDSAFDSMPVWSPDGTEIVFASDCGGDFEIYVMNADGSNVRKLTGNRDFDSRPSWSFDGTQILFASDRDGDEEIYVMSANGANVRRLTSNSAVDTYARWAPRKRGVELSEASVVIPDSSTLAASAVQDVTANARAGVVRIVTDLGSGSGFVVGADGLILTNNHVISDASEITVYLEDGSSYEGTVQGRDLVRDLALVKIETTELPFLELGNLSQLPLASDVLVLGYPLGETDLSVTRGIVSAVKSDAGTNIAWVQTDAAVNPGNSGGPLLNLQGQVIGVVATKFVGLAIEGVSFAISSNTVDLYLGRLKAGEVIAN